MFWRLLQLYYIEKEQEKVWFNNIMGVIIDRDNNDLYQIAGRGGVLAGKYARNQFDLCTQKLLTREDVLEVTEV